MTVSLESARRYIEHLDLNYIIASMCANEYPLPRWTQTDATHCCMLYKNFLLLHKIHENENLNLVPTREIDEFWHNHILYTKNYFKDCLNIFGCYLHHEPANPHKNTATLISQFETTKELYLKTFKEPLQIISP